MGKKSPTVSLRKPPPADVEAFVAERPSAKVDDRTALTVYLPRELAAKLLERCMRDDRDPSNVVAELVMKHLEEHAPDIAADHVQVATIQQRVLSIVRRGFDLSRRFASTVLAVARPSLA